MSTNFMHANTILAHLGTNEPNIIGHNHFKKLMPYSALEPINDYTTDGENFVKCMITSSTQAPISD